MIDGPLLPAVILLIFLFGYAVGRYQGWNNGYSVGVSEVSIAMRQQSLEKGYCVLCSNRADSAVCILVQAPTNNSCEEDSNYVGKNKDREKT